MRSTSKSSTLTSFSTNFGRARVPPTESWWPFGSVPRTVIRLRKSGLSSLVDEADLDAAILREQRRVDVGDRLLDDVGEYALQCGEFEHLDVVGGDLATNLDLDAGRDAAGERSEDAAELLGQRQARTDILGDRATLHVDRVGHELTRQCELDRPRDRRARLLLGLVGARAQVRSHDDVVELEQRAGRRRLGREDVETDAADAALLQRDRERVFVDEPAASSVDDDDAGLDHGELALADQVERLGRLRQVDRDDVGFAQQLFERDEPDAVLRRTGRLHVGVVRDEVGAERGQPLRDELPDLAEPDDADGLVEDLDAGELRALPLTRLERRVR